MTSSAAAGAMLLFLCLWHCLCFGRCKCDSRLAAKARAAWCTVLPGLAAVVVESPHMPALPAGHRSRFGDGHANATRFWVGAAGAAGSSLVLGLKCLLSMTAPRGAWTYIRCCLIGQRSWDLIH
ncbi:hypothetical protein VOLCADRAFT_96904 [Volvox carteri f. nagariensis]|uniref:Secreted protein n=1 Tax=Volvox carteri f. nagariensis TaxID=3068 RepID=D8UBA3_VOLCA|nr:uncharacterized protein VOLCADRAFT_96904 [Volvox carteri f. nagariensis]EFJ42968.1 hypothetical protein VOLCADRAFT_96904 [Volvox carteri f. nagariensis]|eukprot:XP_002956008.1 hypothetical protein VOLCADRAFT_96904 [Volvox carteri f. nagariensis]